MRQPVNLTKIIRLLREAGHSEGAIAGITAIIHQDAREITRKNMRQYLRELKQDHERREGGAGP